MRPILIPDFHRHDRYQALRDEVAWVNREAPRDECFMSVDQDHQYTYGRGVGRRTYTAVPMHPVVLVIMRLLNERFDRRRGNLAVPGGDCSFNVCVLNYYEGQHQHLGWHSDDSPEQDQQHPIAVVSFGATREIWTRPVGSTGQLPQEDRYELTPGSLFWMPGGYQQQYQHRIPKHDRPCGGRVSLTYRKLDRGREEVS